jgi:hypothetical protein
MGLNSLIQSVSGQRERDTSYTSLAQLCRLNLSTKTKIQFRRRRVLIKNATMCNIQNCDRYTGCARKVMSSTMLCTNRQRCCHALHMEVRLTLAVDTVQFKLT